MQLSEFIELQSKAIITALNDPAFFPIAAKSPDFSVAVSHTGNHFRWDETRRKNACFVRFSPTSMFPEYWVHVDYTNYRSAFISFLNRYFKLLPHQVDSNYHVDHMLNRAFGRIAGGKYIRLALVSARQNLTYGATMEKRALAIRRQHPRGPFPPEYLTCFKLLNIPRPISKGHYLQIKPDIINQLSKLGLEPNNYSYHEQLLDTYFDIWPII